MMNVDLFHLHVYGVTVRHFVKALILHQSVPPEEYKLCGPTVWITLQQSAKLTTLKKTCYKYNSDENSLGQTTHDWISTDWKLRK